jgi:predicted acetyltransferase
MSGLTYAPADRDRDLPALSRIMAHAFGGGVEEFPPWFEKAGPANFRVVREGADGAAVGCLLLIPMGQFFGGRSIPLTGIAAVGVAPEARGRGVASAMMREAVREIRAAGVPLSGLYPATQPLYRRVGYEQAGYRFEYRIPIVRVDAKVKGGDGLLVRAAAAGDLSAIKACYHCVARETDGHLDRGDYIWNRVQSPRQGPASVFVVEGDGGIEGYVYLRQERGHPNGRHDVHISDWCAATEWAGRRVLALAGEFGSMGEELVCHGGPSIPMLMLLPEQRMSVKLRDYWMIRIVDLPGAVAARGWPVGIRSEAHFELIDELFDENAGKWVVRVEDGKGVAERGGGGDLRTDIGSLASWFTGYSSLATLRRLGRLVGTDAAIARAAGIIAAGTPWMSEMY